MKTKNAFLKGLIVLLLLSANLVVAQTTISGSVVDTENNEAIPGANIIVVGSNTGTVADFDGNFILNTSSDFPLTLEVSYIAFFGFIIFICSSKF